MFIFNELSVIVLRETNAQWYKPSFRSPLYPYVQLFGIVSGIVLLAFLGIMPIVSVFGVFALGFIIFLIYGRNSDRSGVISNYGILSFLFKGSSSSKSSSSNKADNYEEMTDADAEIVVPLLGDETSTEMLVEIAASINDKSKLNTVNLIEIPNQTFLEAIDIDSPISESKKRRVLALKKTKQINVSYESLTTHDLSLIHI